MKLTKEQAKANRIAALTNGALLCESRIEFFRKKQEKYIAEAAAILYPLSAGCLIYRKDNFGRKTYFVTFEKVHGTLNNKPEIQWSVNILRTDKQKRQRGGSMVLRQRDWESGNWGVAE